MLSPTHAPPALDDLLRERAAIHPIRTAVPHLWALLDAQIARHLDPATRPAPPMALSTSTSSTASTSSTSSLASSNSLSSAALASNPHPQQPIAPPHHHNHHAHNHHHHSQPGLLRSNTAPLPSAQPPSSSSAKRPAVASRKRIKIPVPADKFPDYNFVGRLLGPRGTTLKTLERDTRCKIMIRGKGSIRKDKEPDVRGKPGWEHVFNEPLHVVIELADMALDEGAATTALNRAKDAVEFLLVPVPEERDALKRQQLRALAIMNGTYRGAPARSMDHLSIPSAYNNNQQQSLHHHAQPSPSHSLSSFAEHLANSSNAPPAAAPFLHEPSLSAHMLPSPFDTLSPRDDVSLGFGAHRHAAAHGPHASHPNLAFGADLALDRLRNSHSARHAAHGNGHPGRRSPLSGATSPGRAAAPLGMPHELSALTASLARCGVEELATSSVDDTPESSRSSDDGTYSVPATGSTEAGSFGAAPSTHVKVSSISPPNRGDTSLGVGGFIGREFYNGAFSNTHAQPGLSCTSPWDRAPASSPKPPVSSPTASAMSGGLFSLHHHNSAAPSTEVLTSSMSTVTPIERHYDGY